jgi:hypothetical protein
MLSRHKSRDLIDVRKRKMHEIHFWAQKSPPDGAGE